MIPYLRWWSHLFIICHQVSADLPSALVIIYNDPLFTVVEPIICNLLQYHWRCSFFPRNDQQWVIVKCEWEIAYVLFPHNQSRTFHSEIWAKKQRSSIHHFPSSLLLLLYYVSHFQISRWWWPMLSKPLWTRQWPSAILAKCLVLKLCGRCKAKTLVKRMLHICPNVMEEKVGEN